MTITDQHIKQFLEINQSCQVGSKDIRQALLYLEQEKQYFPVQFLGAGYFGIVILAKNQYDRNFAIKLVICNQEAKVLQAEEEAEITQRAISPFVVKYVEHFSAFEIYTCFLVTEYCSKGNLNQFRNNVDLNQEQIIHYILQLLKALKELEKKKIVHLDLKPENILISDDGTLKVCDFGFSKRILSDKQYASKVGNFLYMAPEGIIGGNHITITSAYDKFSAGGIMIYICDPLLEQQLGTMKQNVFPNFNSHRFISVINVAFSLMAVEPKNRQSYDFAINQLTQMLPQQQQQTIVQNIEYRLNQEVEAEEDDENEDYFADVRREVRQMTQRLYHHIDEIFKI